MTWVEVPCQRPDCELTFKVDEELESKCCPSCGQQHEAPWEDYEETSPRGGSRPPGRADDKRRGGGWCDRPNHNRSVPRPMRSKALDELLTGEQLRLVEKEAERQGVTPEEFVVNAIMNRVSWSCVDAEPPTLSHDPREKERVAARRRYLLRILARRDDWMRSGEIHDEFESGDTDPESRRTIRKDLSRLVECGEVVAKGECKGRRYRLSPDE